MAAKCDAYEEVWVAKLKIRYGKSLCVERA
jgi:hypothetical protein